jgi:signal transduction histidine kinase
MAPEVGRAFLDNSKGIIGTLLIASGVGMLATTLRQFSNNSLEYRIEIIAIRTVVIVVIAINVAAIYDGQYSAVAMRVVRIGYWLFAALFLLLGSRIIHNLHRRLPEEKRSRLGRVIFGPSIKARSVTSREWWAYLMLIGGSAISFLVYRALSTRSAGFYANLLPLFAVVSFVYLQFRAIFVDVIVRRGAVLVALFATGWLYYSYLGGGEGALSTGGLLFVLFWVAFNGPVARLLDRQLFGRPDHIRLAQRISIDMMRFVDRDALIHHVTLQLQSALGANWVKFLKKGEAGDDVRLEIPVQTSERNWGQLTFGPRRFGQTYKRDDSRFLRTVANQLAAVLQNFALRDEQQAQARREHELRELATRAELQALRAQINPHFLFNTLSIIADMVRHTPQKAETSILHLAHVFRYALNSTRREKVSLGEELDFLTAYLEIEHERFEERLDYRINVADAIRDLPIPPMLIQPVVENAVKHGIQMKVEGGIIIISAEVHDQTLCVRVEDNGVGFDPRAIQKNHKTVRNESHGMGLVNVRDRIEKLSGAENFRIKSALGMGTIVEIGLRMV